MSEGRKVGEPSNLVQVSGAVSPKRRQLHFSNVLNTVPVAHAGHVVVDLLTFAPVLVLVVWFAVVAIRDRASGRNGDRSG